MIPKDSPMEMPRIQARVQVDQLDSHHDVTSASELGASSFDIRAESESLPGPTGRALTR